jgi:Septum formation
MSLEAAGNAQPAAVPEGGPPPPAAAVPEPAPPADAVPEPVAETSADPATAGAATAGASTAGAGTAGAGRPGPTGRAEPSDADELSKPDAFSESDEGAYELAEGVEPAELAGLAEPEKGRRGLVFAGLFTVAALAIVGGAIGIIAALTHGFHKPDTVTYRESAVFKLHAGDCVNTPSGQLVSVLPCSAPHQAEVFATFSLPASAWPGTAAVRAAASSGCSARLSGYLNPQLSVSLAQSYVVPDQVAWTGGTRTVICEVRATSGQLTESVRAG